LRNGYVTEGGLEALGGIDIPEELWECLFVGEQGSHRAGASSYQAHQGVLLCSIGWALHQKVEYGFFVSIASWADRCLNGADSEEMFVKSDVACPKLHQQGRLASIESCNQRLEVLRGH